MNALLQLQIDTYSIIVKAKKNFGKSPKSRLTQSYIQTRLEILEEKWKSFTETHVSIVKGTKETDLTNDYFTDDVYDQTEELYIEYKSELKDALAEFVSTVSHKSPSQGTTPVVSCKLPTVPIPVFSGKYDEWTSFKDLFESLIHNNKSLDDVHKLHYLKGQLSGEAERLLRHVSITTANYKECWSLLNSRYENKRFLSNGLLKRLMSQSTLVTESSSAIKELLDNTVDSLNGLQNLGIDVSSWDILVIHLVSQKLDSESRKQWEAQISYSDELPTLQQFKEFLNARFRALEFLDTKSSKPRSDNKPKVLHAVNPDNNVDSCPFCKGNHKIYNCKQFAKEDYPTRHNFVQINRLCFNCLGSNHSIKQCRVNTTCRICKRKHHSLVHPTNSYNSTATSKKSDLAVEVSTTSKAQTSSPVQMNQPEWRYSPPGVGVPPSVATHFSKETVPNQVLLATALVEAQTKYGHTQLLRALLDQGSQATFITESAVQLLGLKKIPVRSIISGLGGDKSALASKYTVILTIQSRLDRSFKVQVRAYVLGTITSLLPSEELIECNWPELQDLALADPEFHTPNKIDVLLGADVYGQVLRDGLKQGPPGSPVAQNTALGWILSGQTYSQSNSAHCHQHHVVISMHVQSNDNDMLKMFWELESENSCNTKKILSQEEQRCEEIYAHTTQRDSTGRYIVQLPFRDEDPPCKYGNSRDIAVKRFQLLEKRFKNNPEIKARYSEVFHEYLELGHMERVPSDDDPKRSEAVYLPHHAVIREDKTTTKLRMVFDASSHGLNGVSLNETLLVGPTLQPDLRHIVMTWRQYPISLCADIVKMYRQVKVAEEHVDYQRIVWRDDPETEIEDYRLLRVTFGTASAPYLAVKTLQQLAHDDGESCPSVAEKVKSEFYVDDLMTGCQTVEEGIQIHKDMTKLLTNGGFELQKWVSNSKELTESISGGRENQEKKVETKFDEVIKILGLSWDRDSDTFKYSVRLPEQEAPITKRKVISDISRLFDPLGWVAPCVITAKIFIQKLWLSGIDWDEELSPELLKEWRTYREEIVQTSDIHIPRWIDTKADDSCVELHGFCDASNAAYAAVVYLRVVDADGEVKVNLVTAKTKVAPIKQVSIPRLELLGAVLLVKLLTEVAEVLKIPTSQIHAWTDSTVVLAWLSSHPSRWTTFVGNRVSEILSKLDNNHWAHVKSASNPADVASRGQAPGDLSHNLLWFHGPDWLRNESVEYTRPKSVSTDIEQRSIKAHVTTNAPTEDDPVWTKFSSLQKLLHVIAYCRRFLRVRGSDSHMDTHLTNEELGIALEVCIRHFQEREFGEDILDIQKTGSVKSKSKLKPLCPMLDDKGILRVGGRIQNADIDINKKHPIILPQKSHLTDLIVDVAHLRTLHGGASLTLNYLRSKYWVISAKNVTKSHVRKCVTCIRHAAVSRNQLMGQLPSSRVTPTRPFLHTGVDFAGPIIIRMSKGRGNRSFKGYICFFVCMATKAVHLEAISDLTSQGFIAGFKRFVARRGHCSDIWSDNGTNFVGASKELQTLVAAEQSSVAVEIRSWLSKNSVSWHFIPPHAPNFGGLWEAGVKSTKFHLKRVIGDSTLTFEEMVTVLTQIEACLNSRPISQVSSNPDDPMPLTPGHFIIGEPMVTIPERNYEACNLGSLRRWQVTQRMVQDFWRRWSEEYLIQMLHRYKWAKQTPEPKIGDVVLIKEDNLPPARWLLGKVVEKHPGLDKVTRVVTLKCNGSLIKRPTSKLCILPVAD